MALTRVGAVPTFPNAVPAGFLLNANKNVPYSHHGPIQKCGLLKGLGFFNDKKETFYGHHLCLFSASCPWVNYRLHNDGKYSAVAHRVGEELAA